MAKQEKTYSPLDIQLQNLALINWDVFVKLIGEKPITKAKICLLKNKGKSLNQIANKLGITKDQVEYRCKTCREFSDTNN